MKKLQFESALEIGKKIQSGTTSSVEVMEALLERINKYNKEINAIVAMYDIDKLRQDALNADKEIAQGKIRGPLHGVPVTIKDSFCVAGLPAAIGHVPLKDFIPDFDATVVSRLREAGAIIVGKTNVPTLLMDQQAYNPIYGTTNNPWDYDRTCGGSSGGSAAAIASGLSYLEIGSDIAGSLRVPAHFCGIYSLKPTELSVSSYGHMEGTEDKDFKLLRHLCTYGPLARSIDDLIVAYSIIGGFDGKDIHVPALRIPDKKNIDLKELKIAWMDEFPDYPVSKEIKEQVSQFISKLESIGVKTTKIDKFPVDINKVWKTYGNIFFSELEAPDPVLRHEGLKEMNNPGWQDIKPPVTLEKYFRAWTRREQLVSAFDEFIAAYDMFIMPVTRSVAFPHVKAPFDKKPPILMDQQPIDYWTNMLYTMPFNVLQTPAVTVPIGLSKEEGVPMAIQCVGRMWSDIDLMHTVNQVAQAMDLQLPHPSL